MPSTPRRQPDNRRLLVRIIAGEFIHGLTRLSSTQGGDIIRLLVFTGIWVSNTGHLTSKTRYAALRDIPPDAQRRPVSDAALVDMLSMPADIVSRYVEELLADGLVERVSGGLVAPAAVFTDEAHLRGSTELHDIMRRMVGRLRDLGFDLADDKPGIRAVSAS